MSFKKVKQRGQAMLLFGVLVPVLFALAGVGIDLGWYYLNVSRLQNAADAAALAGAHKIIADDEKFKSYDDDAVRLVKNIFGDEPDDLSTAGDELAASYVLKNLSPDNETEAVKLDDAYIMHDEWGFSGRSEIKMAPSLYKIGDTYYYVINLEEKIRHLFMPGLFDDMNAPVVAVAILAQKTNAPDDPNDPVVPEEEQEEIEVVLNKNVIVGNWEVQNYYRYLNNSSNDKTTVEDEKTGKTVEKTLSRSESFYNRFGFEVYTSAWNMFQDDRVHYKNGELYRKEIIKVFDDVKLVDDSKTGSQRYSDDNMKSFGRTGNGNNIKNPTPNGSSVQKTQASSNGNDVNSYTYNTAGNPYVAEITAGTTICAYIPQSISASLTPCVNVSKKLTKMTAIYCGCASKVSRC